MSTIETIAKNGALLYPLPSRCSELTPYFGIAYRGCDDKFFTVYHETAIYQGDELIDENLIERRTLDVETCDLDQKYIYPPEEFREYNLRFEVLRVSEEALTVKVITQEEEEWE